MFRNPRENASSSVPSISPSTGRPPTPPDSRTPYRPPATMTLKGSTKPLTSRTNSNYVTPSALKSSPIAKKTPASKVTGKPNTSILSFFKKVDSPLKEESIFLSQGTKAQASLLPPRFLSHEILDSQETEIFDDVEAFEYERFNESAGSVKKRKTSNGGTPDSIGNTIAFGTDDLAKENPPAETCTPPPPEPVEPRAKKKPRRRGPFLSDSEDEDYVPGKASNEAVQNVAVEFEKRELRGAVQRQPEEVNLMVQTVPIEQDEIEENRPVNPAVDSAEPIDNVPWTRYKRVPIRGAQELWEALQPADWKERSRSITSIESETEAVDDTAPRPSILPQVPTLKQENTSVDEWGTFEGLEDFPDEGDEFADGEEFVERKWMEEQARLEALENGVDGEELNGIASHPGDDAMTASCPICDASLNGLDTDQATRHVNGCLDGNPIPLPEPAIMVKADVHVKDEKSVKKEPSDIKYMPAQASNAFARKAAIARPGQANPFEIGSATDKPSSAFSKLMSGHAEDAAWASAAAAEHSARGKPAYQRTCPFYKIMPGFFICVDAFRYGAVEGCKAYFLSHFHSDHYVGLTSSWCHGPIYCSKVTANLVKQQLRVDPKWVVPLTFEERFEVPGTQGVAVTMIPANHCPGSSLYLFEKVVGKGSTPKIQRVLHCGDFRACPAHISHPLLMPDIVDTVTNKTKQQKIDVCYLDTTYLNPRYAFPSQEEVIQACADMCISLTKDRPDLSDAWEQSKKQRAGMDKFLSESSPTTSTTESPRSRGRLLVVCGTYSIGKERICMGIARALDCKIWAPPGKMRICAALEDPELMSRMTSDPKEAQIHMQMLMEIRPETLQEYLEGYRPHFSRVVGFRPSGWNYKPPTSRSQTSPIPQILYSPSWRSSFGFQDLVPQRGSSATAACYGVPYSEHSSFRELTMFVCALRIEKVVPTVNVGSAVGRGRMKGWIDRWLAERRKNGVVRIGEAEGEVRW